MSLRARLTKLERQAEVTLPAPAEEVRKAEQAAAFSRLCDQDPEMRRLREEGAKFLQSCGEAFREAWQREDIHAALAELTEEQHHWLGDHLRALDAREAALWRAVDAPT